MTQPIKPMQVIQQGGETFIPVSTWNDALQLSAGTHKEYDVAAMRVAAGLAVGQAVFCIFSCDGPFWTNFAGTAAIPSGDIVNGTASEFAPNARYLDSTVTSISFIAANDQKLSLQLFRP